MQNKKEPWRASHTAGGFVFDVQVSRELSDPFWSTKDKSDNNCEYLFGLGRVSKIFEDDPDNIYYGYYLSLPWVQLSFTHISFVKPKDNE